MKSEFLYQRTSLNGSRILTLRLQLLASYSGRQYWPQPTYHNHGFLLESLSRFEEKNPRWPGARLDISLLKSAHTDSGAAASTRHTIDTFLYCASKFYSTGIVFGYCTVLQGRLGSTNKVRWGYPLPVHLYCCAKTHLVLSCQRDGHV